MIAVFDNFIKDEDLLKEIEKTKQNYLRSQVYLNGITVGGIHQLIIQPRK